MRLDRRAMEITLAVLFLTSVPAVANAEERYLDELLTQLSCGYWLGDTPTAPRSLKGSAVAFQRLEQSSTAPVAEAARKARSPLGKRVAAELYRHDTQSDPGVMRNKWGDYLLDLADKEIRDFAKGGNTPITKHDMEAFRNILERIARSHQEDVVYRTLRSKAEVEEVHLVSEALRPLLMRQAGKATEADLVTVDLGFVGENSWLTVTNPGKQALTRLTFLLSLECAKQRRPFCVFVPKLPPGGTFRAHVSILPLLADAPPPLPTVDLGRDINARYEVWADEGQTPARPIKVLEGFESRKRFILCSLTPGSSYLSSIISPLDTRCFELRILKLQQTSRGHNLTVEFSEQQSGQKVQLETLISSQQLARPKNDSVGLSLPGQRPKQPNRNILPYDLTFALPFFKNGRPALHAVWASDNNSWMVNGPLSGQAVTLYDAETIRVRAEEVAKAMDSDEGKSLLLFRQALTLQYKGDIAGAKKLYQQIIKDYPKTRSAQTARQNLERLEKAGR